MSEEKVERRDFIKVVGGTIAGLIIGGVIGYLSRAPEVVEKEVVEKTVIETITQKITETITQTVVKTVTPTPTVKPFEGISLKYIAMSGIAADAMRAMAPRLKDVLGVDITVEDYPWDVYFSKLTTEFVAGKVSYDYMWLDAIMIPAFVEMDIIQSIHDLIERDKAEVNLEDFSPLHLAYSYYEGEIYALPYGMNINQMYVRKDLFEDPREQEAFEKQYGYPITDFLKQPDWIKFNDVIEFFHRPPDLYGYVQPLFWPQLVFPAWHTRWFTCTGKPEIDENWEPWHDRVIEDGILSIELLKYQLKYMPEGILAMDMPEADALFLGGKAAVMTEWEAWLIAKFDNPKESKVVGKVMNLPPIGGPKGHAVYTSGGMSLGMTTVVKDPKRREAVWALMKYISKPENEFLSFKESGYPPDRFSAWEMAKKEFPETVKYEDEYLTHCMGVPYGPFFGDLLVSWKDNIAAAVAGEKDPEQALKDLASDIRKAYKPYVEKGIKNTVGITIPQWKGPDYTDELRKQIGL